MRIRRHTDAVAAAQREGVVSDRLEPGPVRPAHSHCGVVGDDEPRRLAVMKIDDPDQRREIVKDAVAALLT